MAKDVITRFKLETTGFDSKIKQAAKDLSAYSKTATQAKEGFNQFTKSNIDAAKVLGTMATSTTNAKDRVKELVGAYNEAAKAYEALSDEQKKSDWAKALAGSLTQLQQRIKEAKAEMQGLGDNMKGVSGGGGLFGGDKLSGMLQVFGGNVMTKIAGMGAGLVTELGDAVKQGIELAKQGEGIRIAFERLGRGDILQGLREATHGTVTDLELMKAAVKFNDFKLPLDELGTMLAFAQQKAKDTGQSVDYMVDSIVTGLGRKSLMILDNLGLSAAQIKEKMAETGDMTKAVGAIIREEMAKAGDYVETAADRATQANVNLQNKMEELGRKFAPIEEASTHLWTSIKIGILDIVGGPLADLLNGLTRAGQLRNELKNIGSDERVNSDISKLKGSNFKEQVYTAMLNRYSREEQKALDNYKKAQRGGMGSIAIWENRYLAQKSMREDFQSRGREVLNGGNSRNTPTTPTNTITTTGTTSPVPVKIEGFDINAASAAATRGIDTMPSVYGMADREAMRAAMGIGPQQYDAKQDISKQWRVGKNGQLTNKPGKEDKDEKNQTAMLDGITAMNTSLQNIFGGIQQLGFEVPQELMNILSVMQTIVGIVSAIQTLSTVKLFGFAGGGIVKAFSGTLVGNTYSGDQLRGIDQSGQLYGLNAGEVVLNRAQVGNLASQLSGGMAAMQLEAVVRGEDLRFIINSNGRRTGRGEIVTTNFR